MPEQLSFFAKPKPAPTPAEIRYAVTAADLAGKTIKDQLTHLVQVSQGHQPGAWFGFSYLLALPDVDVFDVRENWIDCPPALADRICELFQLDAFPVDPAPMPRPQLPPPWYHNLMDLPEAAPRIFALPRDSYILLFDHEVLAQAAGRKPRRFVLGPYPTFEPRCLPLADRAEVFAALTRHPGLKFSYFRTGETEKPVKRLTDAQRQQRALLNLMRRNLKRYGLLAEEMARREVEAKGWDWDDARWQRAQQPPKPGRLKKLKQAKRKTENDELLKGSAS
jgi:hypothetical protein